MARLAEKKTITVICTLRNESTTLDTLMSSLLNQTLKPDEIVVVDGGSTDGTWERLQDWKKIFKNVKVTLKPIQDKKANIAEGRNIAVKNASNETIVSIDGGCMAENNWLEKLVEKKSDVVSGAYRPLASNFFEKMVARIVVPNMEAMSDNFEPSSRNIMFTKKAWKAAGGYPENLYTAEDSLFNFRMRQAGYEFKFAKDAVVYWRMRTSVKALFKQYFAYGYGDAFAGTPLWIFKNPRNKMAQASLFVLGVLYAPIVFLPPTILVFIVPNIVFFLEGMLRAKNIFESLFTGALMVVKRQGYIAGIHTGFWSRVFKWLKRVIGIAK